MVELRELLVLERAAVELLSKVVGTKFVEFDLGSYGGVSWCDRGEAVEEVQAERRWERSWAKGGCAEVRRGSCCGGGGEASSYDCKWGNHLGQDGVL